MDRTQLPTPFHSSVGTKDGDGSADHDEPYRFGRRPSVRAPWPFSERQFARLLVLRGRVRDDGYTDDREDAHPIAFLADGLWVASPHDLLSHAA